MTRAEYDREWAYILDERLGIICGAAKPTDAQLAQAKREAILFMESLQKQEDENPHDEIH